MIKVNLLRNRGGTQATSTSTNLEFEPAAAERNSDDTGSNKNLVMKFLLILIGVGGLMAYESYNIDNLKTRIRQLQAESAALQTEIKEKQPVADKSKILVKEIDDLKGRIKIIKDLSKVRLRDIKSLDFLQNIIPERVWLTHVVMKEDVMTLEGGSISDDQLNRFLDSIEGKSYFHNVILLRSVDVPTKEGTTKTFEISSQLSETD